MRKTSTLNPSQTQVMHRQAREQSASSAISQGVHAFKILKRDVDKEDISATKESMTDHLADSEMEAMNISTADAHEDSVNSNEVLSNHVVSSAPSAERLFDLNDFISTEAYEYGALEMASSSTLLTVGAGLVGAAALGAGTSAASSSLNHAPSLVDMAIYLPKLPTGAQAPVGKVGALVSTLTHGIRDDDESDSKGIAITHMDDTLGQLYFSVDNGVTWTLASAISATAALLLAGDDNTRVYIKPLGEPLGIVPNVAYFRAWDQTSGTNGTRANVSQYGGDSAFSAELDGISLNIMTSLVGDYSENGDPIAANPTLVLPTPLSGNFSAASVQIMGGFSVGDVLSSTNTGAITAVYDAAAGRLDIEGVATSTEYENFLRSVTFSSEIDDPLKFGAIRSIIWQISDADGNFYENQINQLSIIAVNDAPVLMPNAPMLSTAAFGTTTPSATSGELVSHFVSSMVDPDGENAKSGIAIIKMAPNLLLHFSSNGGLTWNSVTDLSPANALHLMKDSDNKIYIQMLPGFTGDIQASFSYRGWDQTSGVDGLFSEALPVGGTSAYSLEIGGGLAPEFSGPTSIIVAENTPIETVIYDASANGDFNVTYSLLGPDASLFSIDQANGKIRFISSPNYEMPLDAGANNVYNISIKATNSYGAFAEAPLTIEVRNGNESVVIPAGLDKNYLESNDTPGTWVTYSDAKSTGFNIYANTVGTDVLSQIQISINGGASWQNMTRSGSFAVFHADTPLVYGTKTYLFRSVDTNGFFSTITSQKIQTSAWTSDSFVNLSTATTVSINANETNSLYGSYNNPGTGPGQKFNLSPQTIEAYIQNQSSPRWVHGGPTDTTAVGYFLTRQVDYLNLTGNANVLNLSQLRENGFSVNQIHGFEFVDMQANALAQGLVTDGISLGSFSTGSWLSNPQLLGGHYVVVVRGGANDALVLSKGGNFDTHQFKLVGTSTGALSAGNFFPDMGNYDIYQNTATKQYILLEQGVQISRWAVGLNAAPVLIASNTKPVNSSTDFATSVQAPLNGQAKGVLVSSLVGGIYDADGSAVAQGIAITGVNPQGDLYYSTNAGVTWTQAASNISASNALLLAADADNRIYFQAKLPLTAQVSDALTYKAWDTTSGLDGNYANTSSSGGSSAFSNATENAIFKIFDIPLSIQPVSTDGVMGGAEALLVKGTAKQNATVNLKFANESVDLVADATGNWQYDPTKIRYVMLRKQIGEVNTNGIFALRELAIFDNSSSPVNIALGKTLTSNQFSAAELASLVDGNDASIIEKNLAQGTDVWIQVDLGDWYTLSAIRTAARDGNSEQFERLIGTNIFVSANDMSSMTKAQQNASGLVNGTVVSGYGYHFNVANPVVTVGSDLTAISTIRAQQTVSGVTSQASTDVTVFSLVSTNPSDNGFLVNLSGNLSLTFNQATAQGVGLIQIYNAANTLIESFDAATSTRVQGWGSKTLTIDPTSNLLPSTAYYLKIAPTAITDVAGTAYAGIADTTTFNFNTSAADGSLLVNPIYTGPTNSSFGKSVSSAGDVNGDGYDDFIIGANSAQSAYVVYGNAAGTPPDLVSGTIASSRGFQISGGINMGQSVSSAGDVNGDGLADLIIGAGVHTNNTAFVVYGAANRTSNVDVNATSFTSSVGFKITGQTSTYLGSSVSGAGDVNGDGFADVIVGAITDAGNIGSAYVIYGTSNGANVDVISGTIEPRLGFKIIGEYDKRFGHSVSSAGDVNGDGYGDVIVGNLLDNDAYVVYGAPTRASFSVAGNAIAATNGFRIVSGEAAVNSYGYSVSSVGDVNGDGFGDVMAANFKSENTFVIYGSANGTTVNIDANANLTVATSGMKIAGLYGLSATSAGDVNGDGLGDMLIGSSVINSGYAYVIYGTTSNTTITVNPAGTLAANIGFKITAGPMYYFGEVASAAGDINGDGLGDLLIGSRGSGYTLLLGGTQWVTTAVTGSGTVTGTSAAEAIIGSTGEDTLTGGGGVDRFFAGMGNDTIVLTASDVTNFSATTGATRATVHGGTGFDTLRLSGGTSLDLTTISNAGGMGVDENSRIESIERIDLGSDAVANTLTLAANDIKDMAGFNLFRTGSASADGRTWTNVSGTALRSTTPFHQLVVDGGNTDSLALNTHAGVWTNVGTVNNGTNNYAVYQNTATNTQVLVQSGVAVSVPPVLLYSSPSDNAYMLALGNNITLTFDKAVEKGTGTIGIYKTADNTLLETAYDVASSGLVTGWGTNKLTINPSIDLAASTAYFVKVSSNAVKSAGGASFIGINDATTLNFTTASTDGSVSAGTGYSGQSGSSLGYTVSGAGDVNGDGFDDYIVSAHSANSAFVVYGDASGSGVSLTDGTIAASKGFKISGGNSLGFSVSGVGDFNGDGLSDVVVGSYANTGSAYVVYGNSTGTSVTLDGSQNIASSQGFRMSGGVNSYLGWTVSGAGDVNGDGLADLMVNGPGTGSNAVNYVVYGRASSTGLSLANGTIGATDGFKIHNVDWVYPPLSSAGDVNGDGFGDVLLYSTVIYGNPTGTYTTLFPPIGGSSGFNISSAQPGSNLGNTSSSAGDVNGDGLADVVIGAYGVNSAYVVFGTTSGANVSINSAGSIAAGSGFRIAAPSNSTSLFGYRVAAAGDINGDGLADVVIGTVSSPQYFTVVYGKADGTTVSVGASGEIAATDGFKITNVTGVVSSAGDINGDGLGDLIFGSGSSYSLFLGGSQWVTSAVNGTGTVTGTSAAEAIIGSGAADTLTGGGGVDRFFAGQGNDTIVLTASDVTNLANNATGQTAKATVHGGGGFDTIRMSAGAALDLTSIRNAGAMGQEENSRIESIERIDLTTDTTANTLTLTATDVKDMAGFNQIHTGTASADGNVWTNVSGSTRASGLLTFETTPTQAITTVRGANSSQDWVLANGTNSGDADLEDVLYSGANTGHYRSLDDTSIAAGNTVTSLNASFTFAMNQSTAQSGDGLNFSFGTKSSLSANYEMGYTKGLSVKYSGLNVFSPDQKLHVYWNGVEIGVSTGTIALDTSHTTSVAVSNTGVVSVLIDGASVATATISDWQTTDKSGWQFGYGGRTGTAVGNAWVDDFTATANTMPLANTTNFHQLVVDGTSADALVLSPDTGLWTNAGTVSNGTANFTVYQNTGTRSQVLVKSGVVVTNNDSVAPVVFDLNRDGVLSYGHVTMDVNGDGHLDLTAWAGAQDGVLVWDKFADGLVHDNSQYAFAQYATTDAHGLDAQGKVPTDLSGLAEAFDSNHDHVFDAQDVKFAEFKIWQDTDQDGVSDAGEVRSLADWFIHSVELSSDGRVQSPALGVLEHGRTMAHMADGIQILVADAEFFYEAGISLEDVLEDPSAHMTGLDTCDKPMVLSTEYWKQSTQEQPYDGVQAYAPSVHFYAEKSICIL